MNLKQGKFMQATVYIFVRAVRAEFLGTILQILGMKSSGQNQPDTEKPENTLPFSVLKKVLPFCFADKKELTQHIKDKE